MKVLIADDDVVSRTLLRRTLEKWGHEVFVAEDGMVAWAFFDREEFPLVISDWMMPGMDGLELVRRIRARQQSGYVYTILLSARSQKEDIIAGMEAGADDFVTKPFDPGELNARLRAGERILRLEQNLAYRNQQLESVNALMLSVNERMKRDLDAAAKIQEALLPQRVPGVPGVGFAWAFKPCDELAGDTLNIVRLDEKHLGLYVLDVSNHGVPAALLAVTLSHLMTPLLHQSHLLKQPVAGNKGYRLVPPAEVAGLLNQQFPMDSATGQYFTLLYGIFNIETREFTYIQAGHPGPIHCKALNRQASVLEGSGLPIGFVEETCYSEFQVHLEAGDRLYLYSDGVPEACNPQDEQFGEERLLTLLEGSGSLPLNETLDFLQARLSDWCGGAGFKDDVSLLALEIQT